MEKVIEYLEVIKEEIHKLSAGEDGWVDIDHLVESLSKSGKCPSISHNEILKEILFGALKNLNIFETSWNMVGNRIIDYIRIRKDVENNRVNLSKEEIIEIIRNLPTIEDGWVKLVDIGKTDINVMAKQDNIKLSKYLIEKYVDILEIKEVTNPEHPSVYFARIRENTANSSNLVAQPTLSRKAVVESSRGKREANAKMELRDWASIADEQIDFLAKFALEEKWYYGSTQPKHPLTGTKQYPLLTIYLNYTFKRLCQENKIQYTTNENKEYAAFNTGLVNNTYKYIYALFEPNHKSERQYWTLKSFVVNAEGDGKILNSFFKPLPEKADYFENKIENMFYDKSTGDLDYDSTHVLIDNISRFPIDFLKENCPNDFLIVDGLDIDDVNKKHYKDKTREEYFKKLGQKISNDLKILNRLKNRVDAAIDLAEKRVEWNYRTAIPMYNPRKEKCSLLFPLALIEEGRIDLALVVERTQSGNYQGHTVLTLNLAYSNSRLITRPDSDWLRTDSIPESEYEDIIDNND